MEDKINYFAYAGITFDVVGKIKPTLKGSEKKVSIKVSIIVKAVEDFTDVKISEIVMRSRIAKFTRPRHILNYLLVTETNLTLSEVGKITKRDHTSVIHSKKTIENELSYDKNLQNLISKIREAINN